MVTSIKGNATSTFGGNVDVTGNVVTDAPAFSAYASATTTIPNVTFTKVNFQNEEFDTNNNFSSSRFTPTVEGYYQINERVIINVASGTQLLTAIFKNGTRIKDGSRYFNSTTGAVGSVLSCLIYLNGTTDYVEIYAYQYSGSSQDVISGEVETWFNGFLARAV